ncbi:hypothetical protein pb186bvf_008344 [Paramecium bursaria]
MQKYYLQIPINLQEKNLEKIPKNFEKSLVMFQQTYYYTAMGIELYRSFIFLMFKQKQFCFEDFSIKIFKTNQNKNHPKRQFFFQEFKMFSFRNLEIQYLIQVSTPRAEWQINYILVFQFFLAYCNNLIEK